ncbi:MULTISPECIES: tetratricopeptide repeat protein [Actinosynnema]|uniref:tetratricopeptide repeat protein n=1 Tax=Actinosynnema TaxID=40566 RepID=UPI0020A306C7|nr:tetratricopeptide repeat protein [Actinosynnema pretiosum]MCP2092868.1 TPR repeat-containing protein [Actinosynnema pretiosum]
MSEPITAVLVRAAELTAKGLPHKAIDLLRPVLAVNPRHAQAWCELAAALLDIDQPDPALSAAKRALVLDGDHSWAQRLAALALSELGRHREAVVSARECVRRKPGDWRCLVVLADVLAAAPDGRREAVAVAREATRLAPEQARTFQVLGDAALRVSDWDTAEHAYRTSLRLDPENEDVRANLATAWRKRGGKPTASPAHESLTKAHALIWSALTRLAALLAAGNLLLLLAGMPKPTPALAYLAAALVGACAVTVLTVLFRARKGTRRALLAVPLHRPKVALAGVAFTASTAVLVVWTASLFLGATTMQPLVLSWIFAVLGGAVVVLSGNHR